ncbi:MAG: hypothetical protein BWY72_01774 [Bacteroidetes bacterium ADurb.Bin416]|nr:MAG: hypothetical protein BWY72_01774 [Bacteroidetes bacterium ADurb.Bin416]
MPIRQTISHTTGFQHAVRFELIVLFLFQLGQTTGQCNITRDGALEVSAFLKGVNLLDSIQIDDTFESRLHRRITDGRDHPGPQIYGMTGHLQVQTLQIDHRQIQHTLRMVYLSK